MGQANAREDLVVFRSTSHQVAARSSINRVPARSAQDKVRPTQRHHQVVARSRIDEIAKPHPVVEIRIALRAIVGPEDPIVLAPGIEHVAYSRSRHQEVAAGIGVDRVRTRSPISFVVPASRGDEVIPTLAKDSDRRGESRRKNLVSVILSSNLGHPGSDRKTTRQVDGAPLPRINIPKVTVHEEGLTRRHGPRNGEVVTNLQDHGAVGGSDRASGRHHEIVIFAGIGIVEDRETHRSRTRRHGIDRETPLRFGHVDAARRRGGQSAGPGEGRVDLQIVETCSDRPGRRRKREIGAGNIRGRVAQGRTQG